MTLEQLIEKLNKLVEEDENKLTLRVMVSGCYFSLGDILDDLILDDKEAVIIPTDLCSG